MKKLETFGEIVKTLREERGLTLSVVALNLGISTSMLGKIEKNTRKPTNELIEIFSKFFQVEKKSLKLAYLSDSVVYQVIDEDIATEILKVAEDKVKYLQTNKTHK